MLKDSTDVFTVTLASVLCTISADVVAIVITWIKTYYHVREAYSAGIKVSFGATLLRYGRAKLTSSCTLQLIVNLG